jgi:haloacetate dehalogenase
MLTDFQAAEIQTGETSIFVRHSGSGPPILLPHGFPETHLMWRDVARVLAREFTVVCADLRGYGKSGCPASTTDHAPYSKRAIARDMVVGRRALLS